jgi:hypothetical protein
MKTSSRHPYRLGNPIRLLPFPWQRLSAGPVKDELTTTTAVEDPLETMSENGR